MAEKSEATGAAGRPLSLIEQVRRAQLIQITIDLIAEHGYAAASLTRIAQAAGITKGAVLYHFPSKNAVLAAAREHVLSELVTAVGAAVDAAGPAEAPAAYVRRMIGHLTERLDHARVLAEVLLHEERPDPAGRWGPLADLLGAARRARGLGPGPDLRTLAIVIGGGIDAIIAERLRDPGYDTASAAETLVAMLESVLGGRGGGIEGAGETAQ